MTNRVQLINSESKLRVQLRPESIPEIDNALVLFKAYEVGPLSARGLSNFAAATRYLNQHIKNNPTSPHGRYVDELLMAKTEHLLQILVPSNGLAGADPSVVEMYVCLVTNPLRKQVWVLTRKDPELEESFSQLLKTWAPPMAQAWNDQIRARQERAARRQGTGPRRWSSSGYLLE